MEPGRGAAGIVLVGFLGGCAFGTGVGAGVARSTEPVNGQDVSASLTSCVLDGYLSVAPLEGIAGMVIGSVEARSRSADLATVGSYNHSGVNTMVYGGVGYPLATDRGVRLMPYFLYGRGLFGSDDILPADVTGELEVGAEIGIFRLWGLGNLARHGFALRIAFLQIDGNLIDPVMFDKVGSYTGRGMVFVVSWRTSRWSFSR